ncbi:MAG: ATP-binding cassette domain-containing protein, partial [Acidimicrobiia bacterium]
LLKLIVGLEVPSSGTVAFAGDDITRDPPHRVRQKGIAMVQQTPRSFPTMSVLENVALGALFGRKGAHRREEEALSLANRSLAFVGLESRRNDAVGNLNLHEQRFLEMARALAGEPRLLLLDEVMAGLNDAELDEAIGIVRTIRDEFGVTVIWVEHVMKAVMNLAERIVVLDFGKVLAEGHPEEVMRNPYVIEAYLGEGAT